MRPTNYGSIGRSRLATGVTLAACCALGLVGSIAASAQARTLAARRVYARQATIKADCPTKPPAVNVRWHHNLEPPAGLWSDARGIKCGVPFSIVIRPLDDTFRVSAGEALEAGYDFMLPNYTTPYTVTFANTKAVFVVKCVSGAKPSAPTVTVPITTESYPVTSLNWYPSAEATSALTYQGEVPAPSLCGSAQLRLSKGVFSGVMMMQ